MSARTHGLRPFDGPRYLDAPSPGPDDLARRRERERPLVGLLCRVVVLCGLAVALPLVAARDLVVPATAAIAVHLPVTTILDVRRARTARRSLRLDLASVLADVALLSTLGLLAARWSPFGVITLAMAAFHRWRYGALPAVAGLATTVGAASVAVATGRVPADWLDVSGLLFAGALLLWLGDEQAAHQHVFRRGLSLVSGRAEAVLSGIGEAIVTTDPAGRVRTLNPAAVRLTGCEADEARARRCDDVLGLRVDGRPLSCAGGCALLRGDHRSAELWRVGPAGQRQPLLADAVPLHGPDGEVVEVVHSLRDITSLKAADEAKTMFLATASHELKTPLAVIKGFAQLLRSGAPAEVHEHALESIDRRAGELASIVDRLLLSSRIEFGEVDLDPELAPIGRAVARRAAEFGQAAAREVRIDVPDVLPAAWVDTSALDTVLDHLLENAAKYSPDGGPIDVGVRAADEELVLEVSDRGVGMDADQVDHCFERFWQAQRGDGRRFDGTGIGLYIVRSLVRAMAGEVGVESAPGAGSTFRVRLRTRPPEQPAPAGVATPPRRDGEQSMIREFMRQVGVLGVDEAAS